MPLRYLSHSLTRRPTRYSTRMLPGARRPRQPDYLKLVAWALTEVLRLDQKLVPYLRAKQFEAEQQEWLREVDAVLSKVYGPPSSPPPPPPPPMPLSPREIKQLRKDEQSLARTCLLMAALKEKLARYR